MPSGSGRAPAPRPRASGAGRLPGRAVGRGDLGAAPQAQDVVDPARPRPRDPLGPPEAAVADDDRPDARRQRRQHPGERVFFPAVLAAGGRQLVARVDHRQPRQHPARRGRLPARPVDHRPQPGQDRRHAGQLDRDRVDPVVAQEAREPLEPVQPLVRWRGGPPLGRDRQAARQRGQAQRPLRQERADQQRQVGRLGLQQERAQPPDRRQQPAVEPHRTPPRVGGSQQLHPTGEASPYGKQPDGGYASAETPPDIRA